jgi:hypothetical protein
MKSTIIFRDVAKEAVMIAVTLVLFAALLFTLFEPALSIGQVNSTFTITQQIDGEISFTVPATNVTMVSPIQGITGGNATGSTQTVVRTNGANGYNMTIAFSTSSSAMRGIVSSSTAIRDYGTSSAAFPTFVFNSSTSAQFGYSVTASTSADVAQAFLNNGTGCNAVGGSSTVDRCWKGPATTTYQVINRTSSAGGGATTTFKFVVNVPSNPSPALVQDFYQATATLTATNNP